MKYTNYGGFEKHFVEATAQHLAPIYFVSCGHEADRRVILEKMLGKMPSDAEITRLSGGSFKKEVLPRVREQSLFAPFRIFSIDELLVEGEEEEIFRFLENRVFRAHLFCGIAKESKILAEAAKKGAVWLDLGREKPWEREKRLLITLREYVLKAGKSITPDLLEQIVHLVGGDWQTLERELEKLLSFVGTLRDITPADVQKVVAGHATLSTWQMAEEVVWGKTIPLLHPLDTSELLSLLGAMRYQIQVGWQLASSTPDEPPAHLKPYQIQKYGKLAHGKPALFFENALLKLSELEILAKSSGLDPRLLITRFAAQLQEL